MKPWYCSPIQTRHFLPVVVVLSTAPMLAVDKCEENLNPSFYEDSPNATNHFPLCLLPLQCVATPQPQSLNDSIKIDKTKHKSCKFYNLGQPTHSRLPTSINLEYQSALLCTLALKVFVMSTVPGMQAIQTPCMFDCHQKSFLSFLSSLV